MKKSDGQTTSFMKSLFAGQINQSLLMPYPKMDKDEKDSVGLIIQAWDEFAKATVDSTKIDTDEKLPDEVLNGLKELGFMGLSIPEAFDGAALSKTAYCKIFEAVSAVDASVAVTLGAHASIGTAGLLLFGTDEQKKRYLPKLASGEWIASFALTEPDAGSDAAGIRTRAVLDEKKQHFILNGSKIWISNGGITDLVTVFAKTEIMQNGEKTDKITAFLVEASWDGFSAGKPEHKYGIRGSNTTSLNFDNVKVPVENVLGPIGKGFKVAMEILNKGRLGLASGCVGGCKAMIEEAVKYSTSRVQFNKPIAEFEIIRGKISELAAETYAADSMTYLTTGLLDQRKVDVSLESAICKIFASELVLRTADELMQIAGGLGYSKDYPYERYLRDARINMIFEGTNEILQLFIALSGIQGPGEYLKNIGKALKNPIKGFGLLTGYAVGKMKTKLVREHLKDITPPMQKWASRFANYSAELAHLTEKVIMRHGKNIIMKQFVLQRLANMAIDLYGMAAVITRIDSAAKAGTSIEKELPLATLYCSIAWRRIRREARQVISNRDKIRIEISDMLYEDGKFPR